MKIVILGGGIVGLALAIELHRIGATQVLVLDRGHSPATWAAAGMIAPRAEGLRGALLDLGLASRALWPAWAAQLEEASGEPVDYRSCGVLLPAQNKEAVEKQNIALGEGCWWEREEVLAHIPGICETIAGGLWFEKEGAVDNRRVLVALRAAAERLGIAVQSGVNVLGPADPDLRAVTTDAGLVSADRFVLAQGAWSGTWLDLPVQPLKGQMLALKSQPEQLRTVLYGEGVYLVPRRDGRIVVGATQEQVGFEPGNTAAGIHALLTNALALVPGLADCPLVEQWWGFRPATPDAAPLLGQGPWPHLHLATGHHRNGILLAPITARLLAREIVTGEPQPLLAPFSYRRFCP
ncbi:glycine oxidase ThiO [Gloeobacter kilaueensis]|uniref:glycine oxidase n=1 Tax=Gloeobacter kilaueensis (strain ATCC BAA-2537 / CCAP 1431/1 / ULC 316 / JS1) TaxID=1183438 RepID=U5QE27_GLOK1|nr:glycine oxidase ThiO [Gloeobacter kilaueensis]AGY57176.1 glycine oxidase ThiO [Gloeobacter kilaueensis JS1]